MATGNQGHALVWRGTAESVVDVHPVGFEQSLAYATDGFQQVGSAAGPSTGGYFHAFLWGGTAASAIDLNPAGFTFSEAHGISASQQVGYGYGVATGSILHALLWSGTAESFVDLNPTGFATSTALGINGSQVVGYGFVSLTEINEHALLWRGTAASAIDLHQFLPPEFVRSEAMAINSQGDVVGFARSASELSHAVLWRAVPEPATFGLLAAGLGALLAYGLRRRRKSQGG